MDQTHETKEVKEKHVLEPEEDVGVILRFLEEGVGMFKVYYVDTRLMLSALMRAEKWWLGTAHRAHIYYDVWIVEEEGHHYYLLEVIHPRDPGGNSLFLVDFDRMVIIRSIRYPITVEELFNTLDEEEVDDNE